MPSGQARVGPLSTAMSMCGVRPTPGELDVVGVAEAEAVEARLAEHPQSEAETAWPPAPSRPCPSRAGTAKIASLGRRRSSRVLLVGDRRQELDLLLAASSARRALARASRSSCRSGCARSRPWPPARTACGSTNAVQPAGVFGSVGDVRALRAVSVSVPQLRGREEQHRPRGRTTPGCPPRRRSATGRGLTVDAAEVEQVERRLAVRAGDVEEAALRPVPGADRVEVHRAAVAQESSRRRRRWPRSGRGTRCGASGRRSRAAGR